MLPWLSKTEKRKRTSLQNIHLSKIAIQNPRRPQRGRAGGPLRLASQVVSEAVLEHQKSLVKVLNKSAAPTAFLKKV